jgi:hypothetical protein
MPPTASLRVFALPSAVLPLSGAVSQAAPQPVVQVTPQQTTPRSLGKFDLGRFAGSVGLLERDNDVLVYVVASTDVGV